MKVVTHRQLIRDIAQRIKSTYARSLQRYPAMFVDLEALDKETCSEADVDAVTNKHGFSNGWARKPVCSVCGEPKDAVAVVAEDVCYKACVCSECALKAVAAIQEATK